MTESSHTDQTAPEPAGPPPDQPASAWSTPAAPVPAQATPVTEPAPSVAEPVAEFAPAPPPPVFEAAPPPPSFAAAPTPLANPWAAPFDQTAATESVHTAEPEPTTGPLPTMAGPTEPLFMAPASTAEMAAVPPAPRRRGRAGVIILSVLNFLLLAALGGAVYFRMQTQQQWEADRSYRATQLSELRADTTEVEGQVRERKAEEVDFQGKEVEAAKREPAEEACLKAVRAVIAKLDAGEKNVVMDYDDPCGVPVSGRWTISNDD